MLIPARSFTSPSRLCYQHGMDIKEELYSLYLYQKRHFLSELDMLIHELTMLKERSEKDSYTGNPLQVIVASISERYGFLREAQDFLNTQKKPGKTEN